MLIKLVLIAALSAAGLAQQMADAGEIWHVDGTYVCRGGSVASCENAWTAAGKTRSGEQAWVEKDGVIYVVRVLDEEEVITTTTATTAPSTQPEAVRPTTRCLTAITLP